MATQFFIFGSCNADDQRSLAMKRKLFASLVLVMLLSFIVILSRPIGPGGLNREILTTEIKNFKQAGILLFHHAIDNGGYYPSSLKEIITDTDDESLRAFLRDPRLIYYPSPLSMSKLLNNYRLLVFHTEAGDFIYTANGSAIFVKREKQTMPSSELNEKLDH